MSAEAPQSGAAPVKAKALNCPHCGAALTLRSFGQAVTVVCTGCNAILDAKDPNLQILQRFEKQIEEDRPLIPLGTGGKIRGTPYEVIGYERRTIHVDGIPYSWHEYLLFNPYKGFRYLTEYNGHWNDTSTLRSLPTPTPGIIPMVSYLGQKYRHFQTAEASTTFVLGEFPWQVRVGEAATVSDYISPPRVISSEQTGNEITWSMGEYMAGRDVWKAFNLPGEPPQAIGVYENQPSPLSGIVTSIWLAFSALLLGLVVVLIVCTLLARDQQVFVGDYVFNTNARAGEPSFVSDIFELQGHSSNVEVSTDTNVNNSWIYLNYALINQDTGQAFDFGREVSYYHGYDSDGAWSEGKSKDTVIVPEVPPGHYYLRVEPESDRGLGLIRYSITVRRDVPNYLFYLLAFVALLIPAILLTWRSLSFEHLRWAESDYAPSGGD